MFLPKPIKDAVDPLASLDPQSRERFELAAEKKWRDAYAKMNVEKQELLEVLTLGRRQAHEMAQEITALKAQKDGAYSERDQCVAGLVALAMRLNFPVGWTEHDPMDKDWDPEWRTIIFIDLPTGQVSWHIHQSERDWFAGIPVYERSWDGHGTPEKYKRLLSMGPL